MSPTPVKKVRALIRRARSEDRAGERLLATLGRRRSKLHGAIKLPSDKADRALRDFALRYIEHLPECVEAISEMAREAKLSARVQPLLNIACDYFLTPPDLIRQHRHLEVLLDAAYLAHRLLEEINDHFMSQSSIPLAPMDTTRANIIAHELIGEPFANELDQAVLFSAELLLNEYPFQGQAFERYIKRHQHRGWSEEVRRWPCLATQLDIDLRFNAP